MTRLESIYASCRKVRPKVYWESLAAGCRGKYRVVSAPELSLNARSKLAYGNAICTVGPPAMAFPIVKVKLRFFDKRLLWRVSFTEYISIELSHASPSVFSNS